MTTTSSHPPEPPKIPPAWRYTSLRGVGLGLVLLMVGAFFLPAMEQTAVDSGVELLLELTWGSPGRERVGEWLQSGVGYLVLNGIGMVILVVGPVLYLLVAFPGNVMLCGLACILAYPLQLVDATLYRMFGGRKGWRFYYGVIMVTGYLLLMGLLEVDTARQLVRIGELGQLVTTTVSHLLWHPFRLSYLNQVREGKIELQHHDCFSTAMTSRLLSTGGTVQVFAASGRVVGFRFFERDNRTALCYHLKLVDNPEVQGILSTIQGRNLSWKTEHRLYGRNGYDSRCFAKEIQPRLPSLLRGAEFSSPTGTQAEYDFTKSCF